MRLTVAGRAVFDADMRLRGRWLTEALAGLDAGRLGVLAEAARNIDQVGGQRG